MPDEVRHAMMRKMTRQVRCAWEIYVVASGAASVGDAGRAFDNWVDSIRGHSPQVKRVTDEREAFDEAIWELAEKYEVPLTNNGSRWQDGVFLREMGDFIQDVRAIVHRYGHVHEPTDGSTR